MRTGKIAVGDLGKDIDTMTKQADGANKLHAAGTAVGMAVEVTVATAVLGPVGGVMVASSGMNWAEKPIADVLAFAGNMPKLAADPKTLAVRLAGTGDGGHKPGSTQ